MAKIGDKLDVAKLIVAILLTFVAGYVDAIGRLSLDRVYAAQMSGNVVLLAVHLATGEGGHAALSARRCARARRLDLSISVERRD